MRAGWLVRVALASAVVLPGVAMAGPSPSGRVAGASAPSTVATGVDLGQCLTDRKLDPAGLRGWAGCPVGFPRPASVARGMGVPAPESPLPQCAAVPGVNDRCEQWGSRFAQASEGVVGMVASPGGDRLYIAGNGTRPDSGVAGIVVASFTTAGKPGWVLRAPSALPTHATAITISGDGRRLFVSGYITLRPNINLLEFDFFYSLAVEAATGRMLWVGQYPGQGANVNRALAVAVAPDGATVFVTGYSQAMCSVCQLPPEDWATVAFDARTGRPRWVARYSGLQGGRNVPVSLGVSLDSKRIFVTGMSERPTLQPQKEFDFATVSYRVADGAEQWVRRHMSGAVATPTALLVAPRGDAVYVAGTVVDAGPGGARYAKYAVVAYSATGASRWQASHRDVGGTDNVMTAAALSPNGDRVLVTGQAAQQPGSLLPSQAGFLRVAQSTVALAAASGKREWAASFAPNGQPAVGTALAVSPNGARVYVGGVLGTPTPYVLGLVGHTVTTAYDVGSGTLAWTARYDLRDPASAGNTAPVAVVCDRRGRAVYVASRAAALTAAAGQGARESLVLGYAP